MGRFRNAAGAGSKPHKWRGRWRAYLTIGYQADGNPVRRYVYGKTEGECLEALDDLRLHHKLGELDVNGSPTVRTYLGEWLQTKAREVNPRTVKIYEYDLSHFLPLLGKVRLEKLKPLQVQRAVQAVADEVSARAGSYGRTTLSTALNDAVRLGLIVRNPVTATKPVKYEPDEIIVWTAREVMRFLSVTRGSTYFTLFYVALTTGARSGELFALEWTDLIGDRLRIRKSKTPAGKRTLALSPDTVQELELHHASLVEDGIHSPLMFPTARGNRLNPSNVNRALTNWAKQAGVPRLTPHGLRHTFASMAIAQGMTPAELARQLGHTDPAFTLRRYVHFFERYQPRQAPTLAELTGAPVSLEKAVGGTLGVQMPDSLN